MKKIEFMEGRRSLGNAGVWNKIFQESRVEEIVLPSTLREIASGIFNDCKDLKTVWVAEGCPLDVRKFVGDTVDARHK